MIFNFVSFDFKFVNEFAISFKEIFVDLFTFPNWQVLTEHMTDLTDEVKRKDKQLNALRNTQVMFLFFRIPKFPINQKHKFSNTLN